MAFTDAYADTDPSALSSFRATLDGHGTWVEDGGYGTVWVPAEPEVGPDFVPYVTAGHWTYDTEYVWVSDYPWGWVTFHYGRWAVISGYGWAWIPGRVYGGAWVVWRVGDEDFDYVGWAPAPPTWVWRGGIAVGIAVVPPAPYVFCPRRDVFAAPVGARIVRGDPAWIERRTYVYGPQYHPDVRRPFLVEAPHGPPPPLLHVEASRVPRPSDQDAGLRAARAYARPATALPLGAPAPTRHVVRPAPSTARPPPSGVTAPQPKTPVYRAPPSTPARASPPPPPPPPVRTAPIQPKAPPPPPVRTTPSQPKALPPPAPPHPAPIQPKALPTPPKSAPRKLAPGASTLPKPR